MADQQASPPARQKLVVRNIGLLLSGDLGRPILDADAIAAEGGIITAVGRARRTWTPGC